MKQKAFTIAALLLACTLVQADEEKSTSASQATQFNPAGLYFGIGISKMSLRDDTTDEEFSAKGISLLAGYQLHQYVAIEGRYTADVGNVEYDHGSNSAQTSTDDYPTSFSNLGLYVKPMYQFDSITPYALLGYGKTKVSNIPYMDMTSTEYGFQWGLGVQYEFNKNITAFFDYVRLHDGGGFGYSAQDVDTISDLFTVGMTYKF